MKDFKKFIDRITQLAEENEKLREQKWQAKNALDHSKMVSCDNQIRLNEDECTRIKIEANAFLAKISFQSAFGPRTSRSRGMDYPYNTAIGCKHVVSVESIMPLNGY